MGELYNRIHALLDYRDGELYWKVNRGRVKKGDRAGYLMSNGYRQIQLDGIPFSEHRLVFLYHHGYLPEFVDHVDGSKSNNHVENLRECTHSQNQHNRKISKNNKSGVKGVSWHKTTSKWVVHVHISGKNKNLGYYDDLELAELVANEAREHYHGEFARHA